MLGRVWSIFSPLKVIGAYWMVILQYSILLLPIANLSYFLLGLFNISQEILLFWIGISFLFILGIIFLVGTYNAYSPVVLKYQVNVPKKAGHYKSLRIAMASDMHFGLLSGRSLLKKLVRIVNDMNADLVLLPGDIVDDEPFHFKRKKMDELMKQLDAKLGIYGVLGNHEYYGGKVPEFVRLMKEIDIEIMQDDVILVDHSFYLIGRKDRTDTTRKNVADLVQELDHSLPLIMMDHQPFHLEIAEQNGIDLMLSGHTHRGQMWPNNYITKKMYEIDWGYLKKNQLHAIVSSGFGFWGPAIRVGSRSEVIQIDVYFD